MWPINFLPINDKYNKYNWFLSLRLSERCLQCGSGGVELLALTDTDVGSALTLLISRIPQLPRDSSVTAWNLDVWQTDSVFLMKK